MKNLIAVLSGMVGLAVSAQILPAQIVVNGVASTYSYSFSPFDSFEGMPAVSRITYTVASPGKFSYDFSTAGATPLSVTWSAGEGKRFIIDALPGFSTTVQFRWAGGYAGIGGGFSDRAPSIAFNGLSGTLTDVSASVSMTAPGVAPDGGMFGVYYSATVPQGTEVSFTSLTVSDMVSANYNVLFANDPVYYFYVMTYAAYNGNIADPGGAWLSVGSVPEPITYAVSAGGLVLAWTVWRTRRGRSKS